MSWTVVYAIALFLTGHAIMPGGACGVAAKTGMAVARHPACRALKNPLATAGGYCGATESVPLLAKTVCFQLTIRITTARDGGSVQ